jgi:hypothetical protein
MANQGAARFYKRLVGIKCGRFKVPEGTEFEYVERLSKWKLSQEEWSAALDLIADDKDLGEGLPQLVQIYPYLKRAEIKTGPTQGLIWQTFDLGGIHYARKIQDPINPPAIPEGATNSRTHLPPEMRYHGDVQENTR